MSVELLLVSAVTGFFIDSLLSIWIETSSRGPLKDKSDLEKKAISFGATLLLFSAMVAFIDNIPSLAMIASSAAGALLFEAGMYALKRYLRR